MIHIKPVESDRFEIVASADELYKFLTNIRTFKGQDSGYARDVLGACESIEERSYMRAFVMTYEISQESIRNIIAKMLPGDCDKSLLLKKIVQLASAEDI